MATGGCLLMITLVHSRGTILRKKKEQRYGFMHTYPLHLRSRLSSVFGIECLAIFVLKTMPSLSGDG
jgi:hypothetical protein